MARMRGVVALLTDFGLEDPYVGIVKGVIYSVNPEAKVIDITHSIEKYNIKQGAFVLYHAVDYFPRHTVYLACVDPGVGTERKCIIVESEGAFFVGPDNGLLIPAAKKLGLKAVYEVRVEARSHTFHARDIFAPTAARLSMGEEPSSLGFKTRDYVDMGLPSPRETASSIAGEIIYVDSFGNLVTNIPGEKLFRRGIRYGDRVRVVVNGRELRVRFLRSYGWANRGELIALVDSFGVLELGVNMGSAASLLGCKPGGGVRVLLGG